MITISGNLHSSKNHRVIYRRQNGRPFVAKSPQARKQYNDICWQLSDLRNREEWRRMTDAKNYPFTVRFTIHRKTRQRFDFTNIVQNLLDALVEKGYLPDDDAEHLIPSFRPVQYDNQNPRVEIEVI